MKVPVICSGLLGCLLGWFVAGGFQQEKETVGEPDRELRIVEKLSAIMPNPEPPIAVRLLAEGAEVTNFATVSDLVVKLENASASDCRRWWDMLSEADVKLRSLLLARWSQIDPEGAFAHLQASRELPGFADALLRGWAGKDVEAAMDAALGMDQPMRMYAVMGGADPEQIERLYDLLVERNFDKTSAPYFEAIFTNLASVDRERAANLALAFKGSDFRRGLGLENVVSGWVAQDADAALAWANAVPDPEARKTALQRLVGEWLESDPLMALERMGDKIDFTQLRRQGGTMPTGKLSGSDFDKLIGHADRLAAESPAQAASLLEGIVSALYQGDHPERLADIASRLVGSGQIEWGVTQAAKSWTKKDEDGLVEFINSVENETVRTAAVRGLVNQLSTDEPLRALELLDSLDEPVTGIDVRSLVGGAFRSGLPPDEVIAGIPEAARDQSLGVFGDGSYQSTLAPAEIAAFLDRQSSGEHRDRAMMFVAGDWARAEPVAAAAWVTGMEPGKIRENAAGTVVSSWATIDFEKATDWAMALGDPASRSRALASAAGIAAANDPQRALEIAAEISDATLRQRAVSAGLRVMSRLDPQRAIDLLGEADVDDVTRQRIRNTAEEVRSLQAMLEP